MVVVGPAPRLSVAPHWAALTLPGLRVSSSVSTGFEDTAPSSLDGLGTLFRIISRGFGFSGRLTSVFVSDLFLQQHCSDLGFIELWQYVKYELRSLVLLMALSAVWSLWRPYSTQMSFLFLESLFLGFDNWVLNL